MLLPARREQGHGDQPVAFQGVGDHLLVAGLENVERQAEMGKQNDVGQWKDRNEVGQLLTGVRKGWEGHGSHISRRKVPTRNGSRADDRRWNCLSRWPAR